MARVCTTFLAVFLSGARVKEVAADVRACCPSSSAHWKVGRTILCTPRESAKTGTFRTVSDPHGVQRTARPTTEPLGQHAQPWAATPCLRIQRGAPLALVWQRVTWSFRGLLQILRRPFWRVALELAPLLVHLPVVKHN